MWAGRSTKIRNVGSKLKIPTLFVMLYIKIASVSVNLKNGIFLGYGGGGIICVRLRYLMRIKYSGKIGRR